MNLQQDIAFLDSYMESPTRIYNHRFYQHRLQRVYLYDLDENILDAYKAVIIPDNIDQEFLYRHKDKLEKFLGDGKILITFGQVFKEWLPGGVTYQRSSVAIKDRRILANPEHPIFDGVTEYDLNYRRGIKGFFSRGYFYAPEGSEIVLKDSEGESVIYINRTQTNGTILAGAGTDLLAYGNMDNNTSRRIGLQLIQWIDAEEKRLQA